MAETSKTRLKFFDWLLLIASMMGSAFFGYLLVYPEPVIRYFIYKEASGKQIGVVSSATNDVRRRLNRSLTWYKVRPDEVIFENDTIFTGTGSELNIQLDNDISFRLGENSLVILSAADDGTFELDLQLGSVVAGVKGKKALKLKGKDEDATIYGSGVESRVSINKNKEGKLSLASLSQSFEFEAGGEKNVIDAKKTLKLDADFAEDSSARDIELVYPPLGHLIWHRANEDFKFEWSNPKNLNNLKLQVSKDEDFGKITYQKGVTGAIHRVPGVKIESKYFWRLVTEVDGRDIEVSEIYNFQLAMLRPPLMRLPKKDDVIQSAWNKEGYPLAMVQFQWEKRLGVQKYHLQVANDESFREVILNEVTSDSSKNLVELAPSVYYWRVRVSAPVEASGTWPAGQKFTVTIPGAAKALIAESKQKKLDEQRLDRGLPDAPAFRSLDPGVLGSQIIEKKIPLLPPTTSESQKMVLLNFDPALNSREPAAVNKAIMNPPTLKWNPTPGATGYEIEVSEDKAFTQIKEAAVVKEPKFTWKEPQVGGFFWRVRSSRGLGKYSDFSKPNKLAVGLESPKLPPELEKSYTAKSPKEFLKPGPTMAVTWKPLPKANGYKVVVMDQNSRAKVFETVTKDYGLEVSLPKSGEYQAMVAATNEKGKLVSPFSEPSTLKFEKKLDFKKPKISYPVNGTTVVSFGGSKTNSMILDWTKVSGAKGYRLQFSKTKDFKKVFLDKKVAKDQYFVNDEFPGGTIYWRVRAEYEGLDSGWTEPRYFDIQAVQ
jgi:hypothetical protein